MIECGWGENIAADDKMGKNTDGGDGVATDPAGQGTHAQDTGSKPEERGVSKADNPTASNNQENKVGDNTTKPADPGESKPDDNTKDRHANDQGENGVVPEVREGDDVNFNDSVSNVRSQVGTSKEKPSRDVKFSDQTKPGESASSRTGTKRLKKGIFVSYSPDASFLERRFVVEMVRQLKENNMAEDIWFDKDEQNTDSPCWFSLRMEMVEKCRAAVLILSDSYFSCPVSLYEGRVLLERQSVDPLSVRLFPVLFSQVENAEVPKPYWPAMSEAVNLTSETQVHKSAAEKTSIVIGCIMEELEKFATVNAAPVPVTPPDTEFTGEYQNKKICHWSAADLQEWLFQLGIKEFYRQVSVLALNQCQHNKLIGLV